MRSDRERLLDILEAIEKIQEHRAQLKRDFDSDEMLQIWTVHYLQMIGEAASRISPELRGKHSEIPWGQIIGTRNVLMHGYFEIDLDIVWAAVTVNLPALKAEVQAVLQELDESGD